MSEEIPNTIKNTVSEICYHILGHTLWFVLKDRVEIVKQTQLMETGMFIFNNVCWLQSEKNFSGAETHFIILNI